MSRMERMVGESETMGGALEDLRAFCAVVELGTISGAARQLGETKGSISRRVSRLEARLGAVLLARTPRSVTPTEEGSAFHVKARNALDLLDDAAEGARQSRAVPRGHLRVTAPHDLGLDVLPELLVGFRGEHPQITVELILSDALLDLAANRIDLALRATGDPLPDTGYRASNLIEFRVRLFASPDYLGRHPAPRSPEDLESHDLVVARSSPGAPGQLRVTGVRGRRVQVACRPAMQVSDYAGVHRLLLAGAGIGAIPEFVAGDSLAQGRLVPVLEEWTVYRGRLHAISVAGRDAPARVRVFREYMRTRLSRLMREISDQA
jgi:DNA-binding transcriptional LysR family regulator